MWYDSSSEQQQLQKMRVIAWWGSKECESKEGSKRATKVVSLESGRVVGQEKSYR